MDRSKVHNPAVQLLKVSLQSQIKTNTQKVLTLTSTSARQFNIGIGSFYHYFIRTNFKIRKFQCPDSRLECCYVDRSGDCRHTVHSASMWRLTAGGGSLVCSVQYFTLCAEYIPSAGTINAANIRCKPNTELKYSWNFHRAFSIDSLFINDN